jgi:hypothetical protein
MIPRHAGKTSEAAARMDSRRGTEEQGRGYNLPKAAGAI